MKCPVCEKIGFEPKTLESGLQALECPSCNGYWIKSYQFWLWKERYDGAGSPDVENGEALVAVDALKQKICPECFKILSRYEVGKGTGITIDRCETCRGMWLDKNEWPLLLKKGLHNDLHRIFSSQWQSAAQQEKIDGRRAEALKREIGDADYAVVDDFLKWIAGNKKKAAIVTYLNFRSL